MNNDIKIKEIINVLKIYKISIQHIEILNEETRIAVNHIKQIRHKFDNEIKLFELDKNKSLSRISEYKKKEIEDALKETVTPSENYHSCNTYTNMIFNRNRYKELKEKNDQARLKFSRQNRLIEDRYKQERRKILEIFDRKISDLNSQRTTVKWWESPSYKLLQHTITRRGKNITLGSKLLIYNPDLIYKALDIYKGELEKIEQLDILKAKAASADRKSRKVAISVKRKISNQIKILKNCPYCGDDLNMNTAHADHIYPISKGGHSTSKNMVYVCERCNMQKKNFTLNKFIQITGYNRKDIEMRLDLLKKDY